MHWLKSYIFELLISSDLNLTEPSKFYQGVVLTTVTFSIKNEMLTLKKWQLFAVLLSACSGFKFFPTSVIRRNMRSCSNTQSSSRTTTPNESHTQWLRSKGRFHRQRERSLYKFKEKKVLFHEVNTYNYWIYCKFFILLVLVHVLNSTISLFWGHFSICLFLTWIE